MPTQTRILRFLFLTALTAICLLAIWRVADRARFELLGSFYSDVSIFLTVSRGLLNGLRLYIDLFENKAPGIFLLGALSLRIFDDARLLSWLQGVVTFLLPFVMVLPFAWSGRKPKDCVKPALAFLIGAALSLYAAEKGGQVFIEPYAAFFGVCFISLLLVTERLTPIRAGIITAIPLFLALGFKEPMVFSILGGALIAMPSFRAFRRVLIPVGFVGAAGIAALFVMGFLKGYVTVYLPHIVGYHIFHPWGTVNEPIWLRLIDLLRISENLWNFSPFFAIGIGTVWIGSLVALMSAASPGWPRRIAFVQWAAASFLTMIPVGLTGDFYFHHFVFAVPGYAGFFFCCARMWDTAFAPSAIRSGALAIFVMLLALLLVSIPRLPKSVRAWESEWLEPRQRAAFVIDAVMHRCSIDRYLNLIDRPEGIYGFTKHSPYGPVFTQYGRFIGVSTYYLRRFGEALDAAKLVVVKEGEGTISFDEGTNEYIKKNFTTKPWSCAGFIYQPLPWKLLFRAGAM